MLVLGVTRSPLQASVVAILRSAPYVLLSIPAGATIDRLNRKMVMHVCDSTRAVLYTALFATVATHHPIIWIIYAIARAEGIYSSIST